MGKYSNSDSDSQSDIGRDKRRRKKGRDRSSISDSSSSDSYGSSKKKGSRKKKSHKSKSSRERRRSPSPNRHARSHHTHSKSQSQRSRSSSVEFISEYKRSPKKQPPSRSRSPSSHSPSPMPRNQAHQAKHSSSKGSKKSARLGSSPESKSRSSGGGDPSHSAESNLGNPAELLKQKLQRAIQAAQNADEMLRQQGVLSGPARKREDALSMMEQINRVKAIEEINADSFTPKTFASDRSGKKEKVQPATDDGLLCTQTELQSKPSEKAAHMDQDGLFHPSLFTDEKLKEQKWVKKLFQLRQKALYGDPIG